MSAAQVAKAITAAVTAAAGTWATALTDNGVSGTEWIAIAASTIIAGAAVFQVPNKRQL